MSENTTTMTVPYVQAVDDAVAAIAAGGFAVVIDDADRGERGRPHRRGRPDGQRTAGVHGPPHHRHHLCPG